MNKIQELSVMRFLLIVCVVIGHISVQQIESPSGGYFFDDIVRSSGFYDAPIHVFLVKVSMLIYSFHMKAFNALTGALFYITLTHRNYSRLGKVILDKGKVCLIPFFVVNLFYLTPIRYAAGYYTKPLGECIRNQILLHGENYLWYLISIFTDFILCWCIERYIQGPAIIRWMVVFCISLGREFSFVPDLLYVGLENLFWFYLGFSMVKDIEQYRGLVLKHRWIFPLSLGALVLLRVLVIASDDVDVFSYYASGFAGIMFIFSGACLLAEWMPAAESGFVSHISSNSLGIYIYSDPLNGLINHFALVLIGPVVFASNKLSLALYAVKFLAAFLIPLGICALLRKAHVKYLA